MAGKETHEEIFRRYLKKQGTGDTNVPTVCPYDKSHTVLFSRMQRHLNRCRRHQPEALKVRCWHNPKHIVPEPELTYHHKICTDNVYLLTWLNRWNFWKETGAFDGPLFPPQAEVTPTP